MYKGEIPFDAHGHPMYYPDDTYKWRYNDKEYDTWFDIKQEFGENAVDEAERFAIPPDWRPNEVFTAVMTIVSYSRGRSAANFDLTDHNDVPYTMFLTDILDLIQGATLIEGKTPLLKWCFCKRGQNYGVQLWQE